ncbi:MAG: hypothetical protein LBC82_06095 [Oscillospiraceae bacterium]|jgi:hypothetical protein|nr:hypothetical protein [Oscillospiraceae bacterium]
MKKVITAVLAVSMLLCGSLTVTAGASVSVNDPIIEIIIDDGSGDMVIMASPHLTGWSPLLSRTMYGASISFNGNYSGTAVIELHNTSGRIASFSHSFTNRNSIAPVTSRTTAAGTYKIVIKVTISGTTTERESSFINI